MVPRSVTIALILATCLSASRAQSASPDKATEQSWTATVQVVVRNSRDLPVAGLSLADFDITESGAHDHILDVEALGAETIPQRATDDSAGRTALSGAQPATPSPSAVLVILPPMSATGRSASLRGMKKLLQGPIPTGWSLALLDDAGEFVPFQATDAALRSRLDVLQHRISPRQSVYGPWMQKAHTAIAELALQPGRHAIVFASDFEFDVSSVDRDRWLLRVGPSSFVDAANRAGAPLYTIQASGPGLVHPVGSAADSQTLDFGQPMTLSGPLIANSFNMQLTGLAGVQSRYLYAADQTGGLSCRDLHTAFARVAADAAGTYRITFHPSLAEPDGAWHPVSVTVRAAGLRARGAHYYLAPASTAVASLPARMAEALHAGASASGLPSAAHVWIFPQVAGGRTGIMAADFAWPQQDLGPLPPDAQLSIYAELVDLITHHAVGSWSSERRWRSAGDKPPAAHWQREATLYPGAYSLRVVAMDKVSGRIATRVYTFTVNLAPPPVTRTGEILIASRCLEEQEYEGRKDLFDPAMHDGCLLAPNAFAAFSQSEKPTIMARIYPANQKEGDWILEQWHAWAVFDNGARVPMTITRANVRGLVVFGKIDLGQLGLTPGPHQVEIVFDVPKQRASPIGRLQSDLLIEP